MRNPRFVLPGCGVLLVLASIPLAAQTEPDGPFEATPQRPSFSTDAATAAPGTVELEFGTTRTSDFFGLPAALRITPSEAEHGWLAGTEFAVGFDSLSSSSDEHGRVTHFGDSIGFGVRRALYSGESFSFAVAPQALFFLREEQGARLGAVAAAVYEFGQNSLIADFVWSGATQSSENNPSRQYDVIAGYGRSLGEGPIASRFAVFAASTFRNSRAASRAPSR